MNSDLVGQKIGEATHSDISAASSQHYGLNSQVNSILDQLSLESKAKFVQMAKNFLQKELSA